MDEKTIRELKFSNLYYEVVNKDPNITTKYARIIDGITDTFKSSEVSAVVGSSGCGKTHFFQMLVGNVEKDSKTYGKIIYDNQERDLLTWTKKISYLEQDDIYYPELSVYESIMAQLSFLYNISEDAKDKIAVRSMKAVNILNKQHAPLGTLSGGERKRAMISLTLCSNPEILILDEPTTGLDSHNALKLIDTLKGVAVANNMIIICTIHQPGEALFNMFDKLLYLTRGGYFYSGNIPDVEEFLRKHDIIPEKDMSIAEFLFELHSEEPFPEELKRYHSKVEEIIKNNKIENCIELDETNLICGNNDYIISYTPNLKHIICLLQRNYLLFQVKKLYKGYVTKIVLILALMVFAAFLAYLRLICRADEIISIYTNAITEHSIFIIFLMMQNTTYSFLMTSAIPFSTLLPNDNTNLQCLQKELFSRRYSIISYSIYLYLNNILFTLPAVVLFNITVGFCLLLFKIPILCIALHYVHSIICFLIEMLLITFLSSFITNEKIFSAVSLFIQFTLVNLPLTLREDFFDMAENAIGFLKYARLLVYLIPGSLYTAYNVLRCYDYIISILETNSYSFLKSTDYIMSSAYYILDEAEGMGMNEYLKKNRLPRNKNFHLLFIIISILANIGLIILFLHLRYSTRIRTKLS